MTTAAGLVITISGEDRTGPAIARTGQNLTALQRNVMGTNRGLQVMGRNVLATAATTGVLRGGFGGLLSSMLPMIGTLGAAGVAISGMSVALSLGLKRYQAMREQTKSTSEATQRLRNNLLLSGLSAGAATSAVNELKGSLSTLAFQTLPKLDFETQAFIRSFDRPTLRQFDRDAAVLAQVLGVDLDKAMTILGEAMQENFTLLNQWQPLLRRTINDHEELSALLADLRVQTSKAGPPIVEILRSIASGQIDMAGGLAKLRNAVGADLPGAAKIFLEEGGLIRGILKDLSQDQTQLLVDSVAAWPGVEAAVKAAIANTISPLLKTAAQDAATLRTTTVGAIKDIETDWTKRSPEIAARISAINQRYLEGKTTVAEWATAVATVLTQAQAQHPRAAEIIETQINRVVVVYDRAAQAARSLATAERELAAARAQRGDDTRLVPLPPGFSGPPAPPEFTRPGPGSERPGSVERGGVFAFQRGGIITRPVNARIGEVPEMIAPLSRLPSLLEGLGRSPSVTVNVQIGEQTVRDMVITVLNDEVALREPSLGLG